MNKGEGVPNAVRVRGDGGDVPAVTAGGLERGARKKEVVTFDAYQRAVDSSDAFDAGDDFLSDVTAFVEVDVRSVETGLCRQGVLIQFVAPIGDSMEDAALSDLWLREAFRSVGPIFEGGLRDPDIRAGGAEAV
jgi:hypothetical protein